MPSNVRRPRPIVACYRASEAAEPVHAAGSVSPRLNAPQRSAAPRPREGASAAAEQLQPHAPGTPFDSPRSPCPGALQPASGSLAADPAARQASDQSPPQFASSLPRAVAPDSDAASAYTATTSELLVDAPSFAFQCGGGGGGGGDGRRASAELPVSSSATLTPPLSLANMAMPQLPSLRGDGDSPTCRGPAASPTHRTSLTHAARSADGGGTLFSFPSQLEHAAATDSRSLLADRSHSLFCGGAFSGDLPRHSPLHAAARAGDADSLRALLAAGPSVADLWCELGTPLHCAVQGASTACVRECLRGGLDIDGENADGITPLMLAAAMGHEAVMLQLLEAGASVLRAVLPGSAENLLHFCVEHEMVGALRAVLRQPEGVALATSSRMKPIYAALMQMSELSAAHSESTSAASPAAEPLARQLTKAKSVVDLLLAHSDVPANASYDDLIMQAHASYRILETTGGSSCDDAFECLLSPNQFSTTSPGAQEPGSRSSRADSVRRLSFTPTANLDCSPANCSPISRFCFDPCDSATPSAMSKHCLSVLQQGGSATSAAAAAHMARQCSSPMHASPAAETPRAPRAASPLARESVAGATGSAIPLPPGLRKQLRVRTRVAERDKR